MSVSSIDGHAQLASLFHRDGYITLSHLFSGGFTAKLFDECTATFDAVLRYLHNHGETEFAAPSRRSTDGSNKYEYPLGQGLKNGYKELVMRSPGRYEMALLVNDADGKENVMSTKLLCTDSAQTSSCLELLLEWIQTGIQAIERNQIEGTQRNEEFIEDHHQFQKLLKLVNTIYLEPENNSSSGAKSSFHLVNLSLVISSPGSETQSWHADGGHVCLTSHAPCHVFNVFVPLVDVPIAMGPTEIRPGSHYYTRDLTKMMLGAMARKELRPTVTPELKMGDALIFDYRILHRGKANMSHLTNDAVKSQTCHKDEGRRSVGGERPILVMTFAKKWFTDRCNFPKHSIFDVTKEECSGD